MEESHARDFKFSQIIQVCNFNPLIWFERFLLKRYFSLNEIFLFQNRLKSLSSKTNTTFNIFVFQEVFFFFEE